MQILSKGENKTHEEGKKVKGENKGLRREINGPKAEGENKKVKKRCRKCPKGGIQRLRGKIKVADGAEGENKMHDGDNIV